MKKSAVPLGLSGIYVGKGDAVAASVNSNALNTNIQATERRLPQQSFSPTRGASVTTNNSPGHQILLQNTQMTVRRSVSPSQKNVSPIRQTSMTVSTRPSMSPPRESESRSSSPPAHPTPPASQSTCSKPKNNGATTPSPSNSKPKHRSSTSAESTASRSPARQRAPPAHLQHVASEKKLKLKEAVLGKTLRSQKMEKRLKSAAERNSESVQSQSFSESDDISHVPSTASSSYESSGRNKVYAPDTNTYGASGALSGRTMRILEKQHKLEGIPKPEMISAPPPKKEEPRKVNVRGTDGERDRRNPPDLSPIEERESEASSVFSPTSRTSHSPPPMQYMIPPSHYPPHQPYGYPFHHQGYPSGYPPPSGYPGSGYYTPPGHPGYPSYPPHNFFPYGPPHGYPMYPPQSQGSVDSTAIFPQYQHTHPAPAPRVSSPDHLSTSQTALNINTHTPEDITDCEASIDEQAEAQPPNLDSLMMAKQFMILQNSMNAAPPPSGDDDPGESNPLVMFFHQILKQQQQQQQQQQQKSQQEQEDLEASPSAATTAVPSAAPLLVDVSSQAEENRKLQEQVKFLQDQITQIQQQQQAQRLLTQLSSSSSLSSTASGRSSGTELLGSKEQEENPDQVIAEIIEEILEETERDLLIKEKLEKRARELEALEINKRLLAQIQKLTEEVTTIKQLPAATFSPTAAAPETTPTLVSPDPPFTPNSERAYQLAAKEHRSRTGKELPRVLYRLVPNRSKFKGAGELFHSDIDLVMEIASALKKEASNATLGGTGTGTGDKDHESTDVDNRYSCDHTVTFDYYEMAKNSLSAATEVEEGGGGGGKPSQRAQRGSKFSVENPLLQTQDDISVGTSSSTSSPSVSHSSLSPSSVLRSKRGSRDDLELDASKSLLLAAACRPVRWTGRTKKFEHR
jgi:hypothetical protein